MADISKIQIENGIYNIKDETARNDINLILSSEIVNVKLNGVTGDGTTDDTQAIQDCIDNNAGKTIYFPDGTYLISNKIEITNSGIVDIVCSPNANFKTNTSITCFFEYGTGNRPASYKVFRRHMIDGGNFDCTNASYGIIVDSRCHLPYIKNVNMTHVEGTGLYLRRDNSYGSGDALIENISITGETSIGTYDNYGVWVESYDNELNNIRIQATTVGLKISGGGNKIYNAHPLYIGHTAPTKEQYERTIGFLVTTDNLSWNEFNSCYSDSFNTAFKFTDWTRALMNDCYANTYITPMQDLNSHFVWVLNKGSIISMIDCGYDPSDPPTGVTYNAHIVRVDDDQSQWFLRNKLKCLNCNWPIKTYIHDYDPGYGLKTNNILTQNYSIPYSYTMQQDKYYKIALISISQALQKIQMNNAGDGEWNIEIKWTSGGSVGSATFNKVTKLFNPSHNMKIALCDSFVINGVRYGYLCVKSLDNNTGLNTGFQNYSGGQNGELFCAFQKYGLEPYTPTTVIAEANLY